MAKNEAYLTLKDHKQNFPTALPCRLINPAKSGVEIISKNILDNILKKINEKICLNLRKNTSAGTDWFTGIQKKERCTFVSFDMVNFYPSITENY